MLTELWTKFDQSVTNAATAVETKMFESNAKRNAMTQTKDTGSRRSARASRPPLLE